MTTYPDDRRAGNARKSVVQYTIEVEFEVPSSARRPRYTKGPWLVNLYVAAHSISRSVLYKSKPWLPEGSVYSSDKSLHREVIWPTWPTTVAEEIQTSSSPLKDLQEHWDESTSRLRDSAKWMATVIGAALASVVPVAPFTSLSKHHLTVIQGLLGAFGLLCLGLTLILVLQVMRPQPVSFDDVQRAEPPPAEERRLWRRVPQRLKRSYDPGSALHRWKQTIKEHPDLYLPCDIESLPALRQSIIVEEKTLVALAENTELAQDDDTRVNLTAAQAARAARLYELRAAAAAIATIGVYYKVRASSTRATYLGILLSLLGIAAIIASVAWPVKIG